jgi:hypothetical protein
LKHNREKKQDLGEIEEKRQTNTVKVGRAVASRMRARERERERERSENERVFER